MVGFYFNKSKFIANPIENHIDNCKYSCIYMFEAAVFWLIQVKDRELNGVLEGKWVKNVIGINHR